MRPDPIRRALLPAVLLLASCAVQPPAPPYPAFIAVDELPDAYVAGLPGVRARQLSVDPRTQRASYRIDVPPDWSFSTGASPEMSVEIYVLAGDIRIGEFLLDAGGYAYLPAGTSGVRMASERGALMLYFLDDHDPAAVIRTPIISDSDLLPWNAEDVGVFYKDLRSDPGSGARSWLMRVGPEAIVPFRQSNQAVEGYLLEGAITWTECVSGEPGAGDYLAGGYFHRPPGAVHGGPGSATASGAVWYLRVTGEEQAETVDGCPAAGDK